MKLELNVNGKTYTIPANPGDTLLTALRGLGFFSVKHGCETGECGSCAILLDGKLVNSCVTLAASTEGKSIQTVEDIGEHPEQGWKHTEGLHPIQQSFVDSGAIQCGFCTPAMVLAAKELLVDTDSPSEVQVREALSGILCRCTGYEKPVQAVLHAAAVMRGEAAPGDLLSDDFFAALLPELDLPPKSRSSAGGVETAVQVKPKVVVTPTRGEYKTVGKPEPKVDAVKLVRGNLRSPQISRCGTC